MLLSPPLRAVAALLAVAAGPLPLVHAAQSAVSLSSSFSVPVLSSALSSAIPPVSSALSSAPAPVSSVAVSSSVPVLSSVLSSAPASVSFSSIASTAVPVSSSASIPISFSSTVSSVSTPISFSTPFSFSSGVSASSAASKTLSASSASIASISAPISASNASVSASTTAPPSASGSASASTTGSPSFNSGTGLETGPLTIPLSEYTFSSFPVASSTPIPKVFVPSTPANPPPVGSDEIPDFAQAWADAYEKAEAFTLGLSIPEKVTVVTGVGWENGRCVGNVAAVGEWPGLCLEDSPLGVRDTDFNTAFPAGITAASTFNRSLIRTRGIFMGQEFKGKGVNLALGPMMNMGRVAQGGRNWEGFGADPFLSGAAAYETVLGLQSAGIQATAKHFINNEQEYKRTQESSDVDDRTEHEIYVAPFLQAVRAGVASVMCSYNLVNDTYACENNRTLNQILKGELGFRGFVMSDWGAQHSTLSAVAGLDMSMPGDITLGSGTSWWGPNLTSFVDNATIPDSRLDDMVTRILASWYFLGQDEPNYPPVSFNAFNNNDPATNQHVDVQQDHFTVVREIGAAGTALLKNNGVLPLNKPKNIAIIGSDAADASMGPNGFADRGGDDGILAMGWGSGTANFPYLISPVNALQDRARQDGTDVNWWFLNFNTAGAQSAAFGFEAAIVFVNADSGEQYITVDGNAGDRNNLTLWYNADNLINAVAEVNNNTIVVVHSVGPSILEAWIENPNVTAVLWAGIAGQEAGNSIVDVLYGDFNPSGRLPYTIAKSPSDYPAQPTGGGGPNDIISVPYTEGLFIDYRHFDAQNITPRFEFGFGLSYTTFAYSNLRSSKITQTDRDSTQLEQAWAAGTPSPNVEGGSTALWLHRPAFEVLFDVKNTGDVAGGEIPQLYLHSPDTTEPPSLLRGFADVLLSPGETQTVRITLSRYDLSVWDIDAQGWRKPSGTFQISVGASSRDFRLSGTLPV
ncbi:hypothetical protein OBBRIDRAFT_627233 [Obba rivulosa]|uniref:beta-glucosidase n=1 Tax=Obba rivulosa TaxID=1052685 RepID=A0A8E2DLP8_9APHY|nr:hypothetical protein OBBRIDRAFT_627233 [Obba rivulosa]